MRAFRTCSREELAHAGGHVDGWPLARLSQLLVTVRVVRVGSFFDFCDVPGDGVAGGVV